MKIKFFTYLNLTLLLVFSNLSFACTNEDEFEHIKCELPVFPSDNTDIYNVMMRDNLKILDIGNSYTEDYTSHLADILNNTNKTNDNICYYNLIRGAASFKSWYDCFLGKDYADYRFVKVCGNLSAEAPEGTFSQYDSEPLNRILSEQWDLIILHQVSNYSINYSLWNTHNEAGYLNDLVVKLKRMQPNAAFAFYVIHSYADDYKNNTERNSTRRWENNVKATKEMINDYPIFQLIIPVGTAIQNLRSTEYNNNLNLTRDGTHLGQGLAKYTASCCLYQSLFSYRGYPNIIGNTSRYLCTEWDKANFEGCIDVTDESAKIAQSAAYNAVLDYKK